ncbi:holin family protein [Paracoccus cavernae]|uniref:Holin family protein n=1 Tax=Paracoccus cavernae TaxID=1571207 RepID=A0ABT8D835_9RHOB|nr:holin family protein [Paracoccus cavernae]
MGVIDRFIGIGSAVTSVSNAAGSLAEVFTPNATRRQELEGQAYAQAMEEHQAEFLYQGDGLFDRFINGLNRLPRPVLTLGTLGLFGYAMVDPPGFSMRMDGLALVPEPLWWLFGAVISFYFGAREAHHFRRQAMPRTRSSPVGGPQGEGAGADDFADNAALRDWAAKG